MRAAIIAGLVSASVASAAWAEPPPPKIENNDYAIHIFQGPVTSAARIIGDAGAYTAVAEACEGEYSNAAAPAIRAPWSTSRWEYDVCFDFTNPGAFGNVDIENRGPGYSNEKNRYSNAYTISPGLELQYKSLGITVLGTQTRFGLGDANVFTAPFSIVLNQITSSIATSFADDQLVLGFGLKAVLLDIDERVGQTDVDIISSDGFGFQAGAVFKPKRLPFRVGATYRSQITVSNIQGDFTTIDGSRAVGSHRSPFILPDRLEVPWEVEIGAAVELGRRPLNRTRPDASTVEDQLRAVYEARKLERAKAYADAIEKLPPRERERERAKDEKKEAALEDEDDKELDRKIDDLRRAQQAEANLWSRGETLLMASLLITGNTVEGIDIADALSQLRVGSGATVVLSPRLALETEIVPRWFTARGGVYLEPARLTGTNSRGHFTIGADVRLFKFNPFGLFGDDPWRIRVANDFATRYFNYGLSLGKYH